MARTKQTYQRPQAGATVKKSEPEPAVVEIDLFNPDQFDELLHCETHMIERACPGTKISDFESVMVIRPRYFEDDIVEVNGERFVGSVCVVTESGSKRRKVIGALARDNRAGEDSKEEE